MTDELGPGTVSLTDAPIGLFMRDGELCLKTEYVRPDGAVDAYIVSSGEAFWGPQPQSVENQRHCLVRPVSYERDWVRRQDNADLRAVLDEFARDASACQVLPVEMSREEQRKMTVRHLLGMSKALATALARMEGKNG